MEDTENEKKTETRSKLSEGDILARATLGLTKSQSYTASDIEQKRAAGFRQYKRDPYKGDDQLNGRSGYVTSDVHDNVNWMLSNLMALFDSQDRVVQFSPTGPEDEALAEQQTDVVNYVVTQQNNFAVITRDWLANGLIGGLGIVTAGYYKSKSWKPAKLLQGVAIPKLVEMSQSEDVEILEASPPYPDPASAIPGTELFDLRVREAKNNSRVEIRTLAPEDFFVSKDAQFDYGTGGIDAALQGFKRTLPRAELTEMGYDPAKIAKIPAATSDASNLSQDRNRDQGHNDGTGDVEEEVELFEVFMRIDANGDGIRELLHITIGGSPSGSAVLLAHEEVELAPFAAFVPFMMPNTLAGMSMADLVGKDQRLKSQFMRGINDNLQQVLRPQKIVEGNGVNIDDLLSAGPDSILRVETKGALDHVVTPFVGGQAASVLSLLDAAIEHRTGVGPNLMGVDPSALQNTTATASSQRQTMSQLQVEMVARMFAETGYRYLFKIVTSLLIANQVDTQAMTMRLRGNWIPYATDQWDADLDLKTNITFGITDKPQKLAAANALLQMQFTAIKEGTGLADLSKVYNTLALITENSNFKNVERFWNDPAKMPPQPPEPPEPNPEVEAAQAKLQFERQRLELEMSMKQQAHQMDLAMERERHDQKMQLEAAKFQAQLEMRQREIAAETQLKGLQMMTQQNVQPQIPNDE